MILNRSKEFALMLPLSIGFWLIFEFYNLYIQNWHYVGLPEDIFLRWIGYAWAFATIWPAILITTEALDNWRLPYPNRMKPFKFQRKYIFIFIALGIFCLIFPLISSPGVAQYLAAPVWLGFIFLLDPFNYLMRGKSLLGDLERGIRGLFLTCFFPESFAGCFGSSGIIGRGLSGITPFLSWVM